MVSFLLLYRPAPPCLRSSPVARVNPLASQHSLRMGIPRHQLPAEPALPPWSLWLSCSLQPLSGLEDDVVFPWKPPSVRGKHAVSITSSFQEGLKQGSPGLLWQPHRGVNRAWGSGGRP